MSNITNVNHLFVPLRYLQFLKIIRSTAAAAAATAENEPSLKSVPCSALPSPRRPGEMAVGTLGSSFYGGGLGATLSWI